MLFKKIIKLIAASLFEKPSKTGYWQALTVMIKTKFYQFFFFYLGDNKVLSYKLEENDYFELDELSTSPEFMLASRNSLDLRIKKKLGMFYNRFKNLQTKKNWNRLRLFLN